MRRLLEVLDEFELAARGRLRGWKPSARGALLIGWPFSPIYLAAVRLVAAGVPYAVDVGDPWVVTANPGDWGRVWGRFRGRARAAETFLWENAAAGVVTTSTRWCSLPARGDLTRRRSRSWWRGLPVARQRLLVLPYLEPRQQYGPWSSTQHPLGCGQHPRRPPCVDLRLGRGGGRHQRHHEERHQ